MLGHVNSTKAQEKIGKHKSVKSMNFYHEMEVKLAEAEASMATVEKEFKMYLEEKRENDKILNQQLDRSQQELREALAARL